MNESVADDIHEVPFRVDHEGIAVRGHWYLRGGAGPSPALIILHGIPRARLRPGDESYRVMARRFAQRGFLSVVFNFRGTGISGGNIGMAGWARDLAAVVSYARGLEEADDGRVALLGFSAGGSVAIYVAARDPGIAAVVSVSSPARYDFLQRVQPLSRWVVLFREIGLIRDADYPPSLAEWEAEFDRIEPVNWVAGISPRPFLVVHGDRDEVIPVDHARMLAAGAGGGAEVRLIAGGAHRLRVDASALEAIEEWLAKWLAGP